MQIRICKKCGIEKNIDDFYFRNGTKYYRIICKECCCKEERENYKKRREKENLPIIERKKLLNKGLRKCNTCNKIKNINEFGNKISPKNGKLYYNRRCIDCERIRRQHYERVNRKQRSQIHKEYCAKNADIIKLYTDAYNRKYREEHKEELKLKAKIYAANHKEEIAKRNRKYRLEHKEELNLKRNEHIKKRMKNDPVYKLRRNMRQNIRTAFLRKGYRKNGRTEHILGCDFKFFYNYLLVTFKKNYGYDWDGIEAVDVDHIHPISEAKTEEDILKLCHYTNLQLLKHLDNIKKSNKLDYKINN